jgi:hypothetical protein
MRPISWIRKLISASQQRRCQHEWAPSETRGGWTCVRCGLHEQSSASGAEATVYRGPFA